MYETVNRAAIGQFEPGPRIKVSVVTRDLVRPWSMTFLPDASILVTELEGRLRMIRPDGTLEPRSIEGVPPVRLEGIAGLMDVVLDPTFATNRLVYWTFMKGGPPPEGEDGYYAATALARGRLDGMQLTHVEELFVAKDWSYRSGGEAARLAFGSDGMLYMSVSHRGGDQVQDLATDFGKILRLNPDGSSPSDNPFVPQPGAAPEIYSLGHRTVLGLAEHPVSHELWETENGPLGGDELNIIRGGMNYGWPLVSYGRDYDGTPIGESPTREGIEPPVLIWSPAITTSGMAFYTGEAFPQWRGSLFVGSMRMGLMPGSGHLQRLFFDGNLEQGRELLLTDLHQRIRDVRQGPDGFLYLLTDEGALLKVEPADN